MGTKSKREAELNGGSRSIERLLGFVWFCLQTLSLLIVLPVAAVLWMGQRLWEDGVEIASDFYDENASVWRGWKNRAKEEWRKLFLPNTP